MEICDMCMGGDEMLCRNGGLIGVVTDGGFAEYIACSGAGASFIPSPTIMTASCFFFLSPPFFR